jgi:hypothetical protein
MGVWAALRRQLRGTVRRVAITAVSDRHGNCFVFIRVDPFWGIPSDPPARVKPFGSARLDQPVRVKQTVGLVA